MLFPDTIYEKDLSADSNCRRMAVSIAAGKCCAAVWDDNMPGSLRIVSTERVSIDQNGNWNGLEDFLYENPGLLAPMARTTVLIDAHDIAIVPESLSEDCASRLLRISAISDSAYDNTRYTEVWHGSSVGVRFGLLLPSKLSRFLNRSFQPLEIHWYASAIIQYCRNIIIKDCDKTRRLHAFAAISSSSHITVVVLDTSGNLVAAISRTGSCHSDLTYYTLSLLSSLTSSIRDEVSLSIFGNPKEAKAIKEKLSGWIDAKMHTYLPEKPPLIDPTQLHLISPELCAAIDL